MSKLLPLVLALIIPIVGCTESEKKTTDTQPKEDGWKLELPQIELPDLFGPKDVETEAAILEINAVAKLKSDSAKLEGFTKIAGRENLPVKAQVHLVKPVIRGLFSGNDREQVILILIANPDFSNEAKIEILKNLDHFKSETNKITILKAINNRDKVMGQTKVAN